MRFSRLLLAAGLAGALLGCETPNRGSSTDELPRNDPTAASTGLVDGK
ncbi:hypothetical protein G4G28_12130 [Massilia sp. Dwa41.01b]|nr:hypothetical protein [Massilia sp. Dwa41.01b]QNA89039.1 hypothetical protein G4G28_12130 [Massilia sp. Dwa41.01b]